MNIIINAKFLHYPHTGIGRYFTNLLKNLSQIDSHNLYNLVVDRKYDTSTLKLNNNFTVSVLPYNGILNLIDLQKTYWSQIQFRSFVKRFPDSIVHIPYDAPYFRKKNKVVLTVHDLTPLLFAHDQSGTPGVYSKIFSKLLYSAIKKVDYIVTDSEYTKNELIRILNYPPSKIQVVYIASEEHFKPVTNKQLIEKICRKYNIKNEYILYIGDSNYRKNLPALIDAYNLIDDKYKFKYDLVLGGNAKRLSELKKRARMLDDLRIKFIGFVDDEDLPALYSGAALFVYPSFFEGFGLPPLEAMSCGTPVISSIYTSIPEVVGNAGLLIDSKDINEIKNAMEKILANSNLRDELVEKGLLQAKKFSWKRTAEEMLKVYEIVNGG